MTVAIGPVLYQPRGLAPALVLAGATNPVVQFYWPRQILCSWIELVPILKRTDHSSFVPFTSEDDYLTHQRAIEVCIPGRRSRFGSRISGSRPLSPTGRARRARSRYQGSRWQGIVAAASPSRSTS